MKEFLTGLLAVLVGISLFYVIVRLTFMAIFKSWYDARKTFLKEEKDVIQKKSGEV